MAGHLHLASESWRRSYEDIECCPRCSLAAPLVHVHGHAQCSACGNNIVDCCQGSEFDLAPWGGTAR